MQTGITMSSGQGAASGGLAMLDVIVLIAMAITAAAFAAGLTFQAGLPLLPVLIGTAALFLVMAASFLGTGRGARGGGAGGDRLGELEEALEIIDTDLQRLDRVEDNFSRLDGLTDKVERLDQAVAGGALGDVAGGHANTAFAGEIENVYARIEALRTEVQAENRTERDRIANELGVLEGQIKSFSGNLGAAPRMEKAGWRDLPPAPPLVTLEEEIEVEIEPEPLSEPEPEPELVLEPVPEAVPLELEPELEIEELAEAAAEELEAAEEADNSVDDGAGFSAAVVTEEFAAEIEPEPEPIAAMAATSFLDDDDDDDRMLNIIREGIEEGRVDLYLQPTVILPDRKIRYFEALTRIRQADGTLVLPGEYMPVAKRSALMPLIDNVLLVRSVQVLRRLGPDTRIKGVFGNVSMHSLLDSDYYPELIEFMEENNSLSENLVFEINQTEMLGLTQTELSCLDTLGALGYTFCLDNVADIEADFGALSDRYFRYVKVGAERFLGGPGRKAADLKRRLDGLGMQLIIEKVEREGDVAELLDHGVEFAQGHLFGEPQPMNAALSRELENAGAH
jgi:cyclic-di-GMP phosphodiesterase, flagellum assembly factor TipF